ncbi:MAG TPA: hypothetical protein VNC41_03470 [Acidimicrobiia bacterium]|nr:hypothetical protein [Acidimicrobiia bacterium]
MAASDLTSVAHIYKRRYSDKEVAEVASREHPTFAMIAKEDGFNGSAFYYPIDYGWPQGVSGTFASAQSGAASTKGVQLVASRKAKYGVITLNGEAMAAARGNAGAFYDLVTKETDRILSEMGDSFAFDLFRDGNGIRGRRASASSNTITLTDANDVRNFKVGMTIGSDNTATGLSPNSGTTTVTAINEDGGTITLANAGAISSFADNDYLFRAGDPGTCMEGFESCTPLTAPVFASDSFRGIDRGADVYGLAGVRINDTTASIIQNMGLAATRAGFRGKKLKRGILNPVNFWTVSQLLGAKVEYEGGGGTAEVGFEYIVINTPGGSVRVTSDPDCPVNRFRMFDPAAHYLKHLDGLPHIVKDDGRPSLRSAAADDIEVRARGWVNYIQTDTAAHAVGAI